MIGPLVFAAVLKASGLEFESNSGQADARFLYLARAGSTRALIDDTGAEFRLDSRLCAFCGLGRRAAGAFP